MSRNFEVFFLTHASYIHKCVDKLRKQTQCEERHKILSFKPILKNGKYFFHFNVISLLISIQKNLINR